MDSRNKDNPNIQKAPAPKYFGFNLDVENDEEIIWKVLDLVDLFTKWKTPKKGLAKTQKELLAVYALYGYNKNAREIFMNRYGKSIKNVRVLESNLKTLGYIIDEKRNGVMTRAVIPYIENIRLFLKLNSVFECKTFFFRFRDTNISKEIDNGPKDGV